MRYSAGYREQARKQLLTLAATKAKKEGFDATGIDSLAKAAGVTSGAVYSLFGSKNKLFAELVEGELDRSLSYFTNKSQEEVLAGIQWYLSLEHVHNAGEGCVMSALSSEIARADQAVRQLYERKILEIQQSASELVGSQGDAWAMVAQVVGAVVISRAMFDDTTREVLLSAVLKSCEAMLGE